MLSRDVRRRWLQYGEARKVAYENATFDEGQLKGMHYACTQCNEILTKEQVEIDHIVPVGKRPRHPKEFGPYIEKMFYSGCQALCKPCHAVKTKEGRRKG